MTPNDLAERLLTIAARISVQSPLGWSHPDCQVLEDAARILRGEPPPTYADEAVLS